MEIKKQISLLVSLLIVIIFTVVITKRETSKENLQSTTIQGCYITPEARCTGSANCRACKNCNYCKHCNSGGSCGVCDRRSNTKSYTNSYNSYKKPEQTKRNIFDGRTTTNSTSSIEEPYYLKTLLVNKNLLNLRSGPDTSYYVIQQLGYGEKLTVLSMHGKWIKVKVKRTKVVGFVHQNGVLLLEN
ncbi:SH3 domain-containing protein [Tenacibaculum sp.]|uniref:SH3 domain-containing protein n=1 Tax=Tenacibaculum sp. TaxID=1906242 RepID=UPI003D10911C